MSSSKTFVSEGLLLFLDVLIVAATNWVFWLFASKLTSPSELGLATSIYSLAMLLTTSTQLGLEYTLLKKSYVDESRIIKTVLIIRTVTTVLTIPVFIYALDALYHVSFHNFTWLGVGIFVTYSLGFVTRYMLLGIFLVKRLMLIDAVGTAVRFLIGYFLLVLGFGSFGLLVSLLAQGSLITTATLLVLAKKLGTRAKGVDLKYAKGILWDGLINTPVALSKVFIIYLSVVLLASLGVNSSDIGVFYVSLMVSLVGGSLASSIALMVIPASNRVMGDLSFDSARLGLSLTAPIIAALIVNPEFLLSLFGPVYKTGGAVLYLLSIGILPYSITINAISRFNTRGEHRKIISIGIIEIMIAILGFFLLVPHYGTIGGAFSMLIALIASSSLSSYWSSRAHLRYVANSILSIAAGWIAGNLIGLTTDGAYQPIIQIWSSLSVTTVSIIALKNITVGEIKMACSIVKKIK